MVPHKTNYTMIFSLDCRQKVFIGSVLHAIEQASIGLSQVIFFEVLGIE